MLTSTRTCPRAIFSQDSQSVSGQNLANIGNLFNLDPRRDLVYSFKEKGIGYQMTNSDERRLPLVKKILVQRRNFFDYADDTALIDELVESLCAS